MEKMINIENLLLYNIEASVVNNCHTNFYKQIVASLLEINLSNPIKIIEIENQYLFGNQHILINKKTLSNKWLDIEDKFLKIKDITSNGKVLTIEALIEKIGKNIPMLKYNSIKTAIPRTWLSKLSTKEPNQTINGEILNNEPILKIKNLIKPLSKVNNKEIYKELVKKKVKSPTAEEKWIETYPFLESQDWRVYYESPFKITTEPYLQSFQYKVLNRILNCRQKLCLWKLIENEICVYCQSIDTIEHHLYYCNESKKFWIAINSWLSNTLEIDYKFTICEVLFGLPNNSDDLKILNYIILTGKWYINQCKSAEKSILLINYINIIKDKLEIMITRNNLKEAENAEWQNMLYGIL